MPRRRVGSIGSLAFVVTTCSSATAHAAVQYAVQLLGDLGRTSSGMQSKAYALNDNGQIGGYAWNVPAGKYAGVWPVIWDARTLSATALPPLGTTSGGSSEGYVNAIDSHGNAAGSSNNYSNGVYVGSRATLWTVGSSAAAELGGLGTSTAGVANSEARGIDAAGNVYGTAEKYVDGTLIGRRPVRWNAGQTSPSELGTLFTDVSDVVVMGASSGGEAFGFVNTPGTGSIPPSQFPVRWAAGGTQATQLPSLSTVAANGRVGGQALGANDLGEMSVLPRNTRARPPSARARSAGNPAQTHPWS